MTVNRNPWVQILITAGIVFLIVVLPGIADAVSDGFDTSDIGATEVVIGTALAAALRAIVAAVKLSHPTERSM